MGHSDDIREQVSEFYTRVVRSGTGCCGPTASSCCGPTTQPSGFTARSSAYGPDIAGLPDDAVVNSLGCGNPLAFSGVSPGDVVLDLGCGAGLDLLIAARKVAPTGRVIGVDMTDEMVNRARANAERANLARVIEVRKGVIEDLPVESDSVDWVISNCVINLSPEKDRVFAEVARVLKPGGRISVSDIVVGDVPDWVRGSMALYASCLAGAISEEAYVAGLRRAGLVEVRVTERFLYDPTSLTALVASEVPVAVAGRNVPSAATLASDVEGKVWSARFEARKP